MTVIGPGRQRSQPIWVDDVAAYFARSVDLPAAANRTFELGGPDTVTGTSSTSRIAAALGKRRTLVHLPFPLARASALATERLPGSPFSRRPGDDAPRSRQRRLVERRARHVRPAARPARRADSAARLIIPMVFLASRGTLGQARETRMPLIASRVPIAASAVALALAAGSPALAASHRVQHKTVHHAVRHSAKLSASYCELSEHGVELDLTCVITRSDLSSAQTAAPARVWEPRPRRLGLHVRAICVRSRARRRCRRGR